ncbi:uncharacterized protein ISCGN_010081 [Ixodes scapularis]
MGSVRAAIAAVQGRGDSATTVPKEYRIVLPPLPTGEAMKRAVILHCDIAGRPYRIEDFRKPLKDVGVIREVAGIGAYQMSHVWLLDMRSDEAKKKLLDAGQLLVKEKTCFVVDPTRQEVRARKPGEPSGSQALRNQPEAALDEPMDESGPKSKDDRPFSSSESLPSTSCGVTLDRLPHQLRLGSGTVLVVVPGRAPICLRCRTKGHIRRDCHVPRCAECRAYGHVQADCTRSYAGAVGLGTDGDQNELLMDEDEAERAAAPDVTQPEPAAETSGGKPEEGTSTPNTGTRQPASPETIPKDVDAAGEGASAHGDNSSSSGMEVEEATSKRRYPTRRPDRPAESSPTSPRMRTANLDGNHVGRPVNFRRDLSTPAAQVRRGLGRSVERVLPEIYERKMTNSSQICERNMRAPNGALLERSRSASGIHHKSARKAVESQRFF